MQRGALSFEFFVKNFPRSRPEIEKRTYLLPLFSGPKISEVCFQRPIYSSSLWGTLFAERGEGINALVVSRLRHGKTFIHHPGSMAPVYLI